MKTKLITTVLILSFVNPLLAKEFGPGTHIVNGLIITIPIGTTIDIKVPTSNVVMKVPTSPIDGPVDPPNPPNNKTLQTKVKGWTETVNEIEMASIIASAYREVAKQIDGGKVETKQTAIDVMNLFFDNILRPRLTNKKKEWQEWEQKVNRELSQMQDAGSLNGLSELSFAYKTITLGMEDAGALGMEDISALENAGAAITPEQAALALNLPLIIRLITAILSKNIPEIISIILEMISNRAMEGVNNGS